MVKKVAPKKASPKNILLTYYSLGEVPKVMERLYELLSKKGFLVKKKQIELIKKLEVKKQFKLEQTLKVKSPLKSLKGIDLVVIGTPIVSFSSIPAVNAFIRALPKVENKKFVLFATGIGLPGRTMKKMKSLLSMKGGVVVDSQIFTSIFEFDAKKLKEADAFFERFIEKI